ncbi:MAG: cyclic nucleotide-binding domain-containing protein [Planctomycetota bacterium]
MAVSEFALLKNMPVFGGMKPEVLQKIADESELVCRNSGDYFFREDDRADSIYVLQSGTVLIEKLWNEAPVIIRRLGEGDCFGEMSLIDLQPRSASVLAETDCEAMEVSLKMLHDLYRSDLEQYAIIMMNMGREVSRRLRNTSQKLFALEQST